MKQSPSSSAWIDAITQLALLGAAGYALWRVYNEMTPEGSKRSKGEKIARAMFQKLGRPPMPLNPYEAMVAANVVVPAEIDLGFADIGGLEETKKFLQTHIIFTLQNPHLLGHSALLSPPKGVLLHGPPGTGKTMLAKALAKEANCAFLSVSVSSISDCYFGESEKLAKAVFSLAQKLAPCIIFFDEIDSLFARRSTGGDQHEASRKMITEMLTAWDGFLSSQHSQIVVIGATNRAQDLDDAAVRRLPRTFVVGLPDVTSRKSILRVILKNERLDSSVNLDQLAQATVGYTGSDLRELCKQAAMSSLYEEIERAESEGRIRIPSVAAQEQEQQSSASSSSAASESSASPSSAAINLKPLKMHDFVAAMKQVKPTHQKFTRMASGPEELVRQMAADDPRIAQALRRIQEVVKGSVAAGAGSSGSNGASGSRSGHSESGDHEPLD